MKILTIIDNNFEDVEFFTPLDLMRRAGIEVCIVGVNSLQVKGRYGGEVRSDLLLCELTSFSDFDGLFIPGGAHILDSLSSNHHVLEIVKYFYEEEKLVALICAAPLLLNNLGLLQGIKYTLYTPLWETGMPPFSDEPVVVDGNLITAKSMAYSLDFGLEIVKKLISSQDFTQLTKQILLN